MSKEPDDPIIVNPDDQSDNIFGFGGTTLVGVSDGVVTPDCKYPLIH